MKFQLFLWTVYSTLTFLAWYVGYILNAIIVFERAIRGTDIHMFVWWNEYTVGFLAGMFIAMIVSNMEHGEYTKRSEELQDKLDRLERRSLW